MKAQVLGLSRIVVAGTALLTAAVAWGGPGGKVKLGQRPGSTTDHRVFDSRGASFSLSTTYTGVLAKTLRIGSVEYRISPRATIYVVGKGVVQPGFAVYDAHIHIAGRQVGSEATVTQIMVRTKNSAGGGGKGDAGILPAGTPS